MDGYKIRILFGKCMCRAHTGQNNEMSHFSIV